VVRHGHGKGEFTDLAGCRRTSAHRAHLGVDRSGVMWCGDAAGAAVQFRMLETAAGGRARTPAGPGQGSQWEQPADSAGLGCDLDRVVK